jgi:hypothetical protein
MQQSCTIGPITIANEIFWRMLPGELPRNPFGGRMSPSAEPQDLPPAVSQNQKAIQQPKCDARWRDCPTEYGPYTTIYNRFNRRSRQGIWLAMFKAVTDSASLFGTASIDSSHVKAHRSAAGGKGGPS